MHHWEGPGPGLKPLTSVGGGIGPVALVGLHHTAMVGCPKHSVKAREPARGFTE